eukprot:12522062-Alexandrium_andersonii.AAC.1
MGVAELHERVQVEVPDIPALRKMLLPRRAFSYFGQEAFLGGTSMAEQLTWRRALAQGQLRSSPRELEDFVPPSRLCGPRRP